MGPTYCKWFLIGNTWEHYRCHEIYICNTKHTWTCLTLFFKHKYLTMPTITPADALIHAADYLTDAIMGIIPAPTAMQDESTRSWSFSSNKHAQQMMQPQLKGCSENVPKLKG